MCEEFQTILCSILEKQDGIQIKICSGENFLAGAIKEKLIHFITL